MNGCSWGWILHYSESFEVTKKLPFILKMLSQENLQLPQDTIMSPSIQVMRKSYRQAFKVCLVVGKLYLQCGHLGSVQYFQRINLSGVGEVSEAALIIEDRWPEGKPCKILLHTWLSSSRRHTSKNLFRWFSSERQLIHLILSNFLNKPFKACGSVFLLISSTDCTPFWKISMEDLGIPKLLSKEGEDNKSAISSKKVFKRLLQRTVTLTLPILMEASDGILRSLGWCSTATEVSLVKPNQDLTHLVASAFALLMTTELILFTCTIIWKYKKGIKYLLQIQIYIHHAMPFKWHGVVNINLI